MAATGSGGATSAPSATAAASGSPGTTAFATAATAAVVTKTRATASSRIGRTLAANWRQEVRCAEAYSSGGNTSGRMYSGGMSTFGTTGSSAITTPPMVISTGAGSPRRSPSGTVTTAPSSSTKSRAS